MNDKQKRFAEEYLVDLNATQAAIRAGYSPKTAGSQGERLLKDADVHAYITEMKAKRTERTQISADFVLTGLKEVALRCLQRVPVMEFDYENRCMMQKTDAAGQGVWEFDSTGANRAFELLGRHAGIFEKDNSQRKPDSAPFTDEQVTRLADALRKS